MVRKSAFLGRRWSLFGRYLGAEAEAFGGVDAALESVSGGGIDLAFSSHGLDLFVLERDHLAEETPVVPLHLGKRCGT